jgi:hypothetical protein
MTAAAAAVAPEVPPFQRAVSTLLRTDPDTHRPILAIPIPETLTVERIAGAIGGLLSRLSNPA